MNKWLHARDNIDRYLRKEMEDGMDLPVIDNFQ